jgi:hypothetical protein
MARKATAGLVLLLLIAAVRTGRAQTYYDDGGIHTINSTSGPVVVENGTTLDVASPAAVSGGAPTHSGYVASIYSDSTSTLNLTGGQVLPTAGVQNGIGIQSEGIFLATGGLVRGSDNTALGILNPALVLAGSAQISGGSFKGGTGPRGSSALEYHGATSQSLFIAGGSFSGGASTSAGHAGGGSLELVFSGFSATTAGGTATITGGTFSGGAVVLPASRHWPQGQRLLPGKPVLPTPMSRKPLHLRDIISPRRPAPHAVPARTGCRRCECHCSHTACRSQPWLALCARIQ